MAEGYKDWAAGDILTAADLEDYTVKQSVMIFDDSSARTTALTAVLREGMVSYLKDTNAIEVYDGSAWVSVGGATMIKKVAAFTASGSWTVPTGVTYAIAHMIGGGGAANFATTGGPTAGGTSSVAFSGGTVSAAGGVQTRANVTTTTTTFAVTAPANSGRGGFASAGSTGTANGNHGGDGAYVVAGDTVTPAASITVTVGAGGTAAAGGGNGGSGYVWIEYYEPA